MQSAFGTVVVVVCAVGAVGAIVALALGRRSWDRYGRDLLVSDSDLGPGSADERDEEIRQLLRARNERRRRRGEPELDAESELERISATPGGAPAEREIRDEIRALVVARNLRRERRGEPPLDVEAEVARQVAQLRSL